MVSCGLREWNTSHLDWHVLGMEDHRRVASCIVRARTLESGGSFRCLGSHFQYRECTHVNNNIVWNTAEFDQGKLINDECHITKRVAKLMSLMFILKDTSM